jgi:hypothetical protein
MAQRMVTPLATSLLHFQLTKLLKNMICILALFGLANVLAIFQKILGNFFPNHLVTLMETNRTSV